MTSVEKRRVTIGISALVVILFIAFVLSPFTAWKFRSSRAVTYHTVTYGAHDGGHIEETNPYGTWRKFTCDMRCHNTVADGEKANKIKAVADAGYYFLEWSDGVKTAERRDTDVKSSFAAIAIFRKISDPITLEYKTNGGGRIDGGTQTVQAGLDGATVTGIPDDNAVFMYWSDGVKTASRTDERVLQNIDVRAVFGYRVNYDTMGGGVIAGVAEQTIEYCGTGTIVFAVADIGYKFLRWSDGVDTEWRVENGVTAPFTVTAVFVKE